MDDHLAVCFTQARNIDELTVINAEQIIRGNAEDRRKLDKNVIRRQTQIRFVCADDRFGQVTVTSAMDSGLCIAFSELIRTDPQLFLEDHAKICLISKAHHLRNLVNFKVGIGQ